jgi:hypothetical protein
MIFGLFQIALGVALIAAAYVFGGVAWVLAWPGVAVIVVGLGYLGLGPRVFGKRREDGRLASWTIAIVLPYIAVAWLLWQLKSRLYRGRAWDEVAPGVRLGRRPLGAHELPPDTRCVVDLTSELPRAVPQIAVRYVCLPTLDTAVAPDPELAALLDVLAEDEGPLFIHCAMGHGRSATVAAALLIRRGLCHDVDEAIAMLVRARPRVRLHPIQRAAVMRLAGMRPQAIPATHLA